MIHKDLLDVIFCPRCRRDLELSGDGDYLECSDGHRYVIKGDVPVLLVGKESTAYDNLYCQINFDDSPFGYYKKYALWRKNGINKKISQFLQPGTVLDNGGGYGFLGNFIDEKKSQYYNMDCSYEILKYDKSYLRSIGEGESLPFRDDVFDNVVSGDVLEHVKDKVRCLEEIHRILKPNGIFVINTPRTGWEESFKHSIWFWIPRLSDMLSRFRKTRTIKRPDDVCDIPSDEDWLRTQLEKIGYEIIVQSRADNHLFGFTGLFWRKFADIFISPEKYGHCVFFACRKK